MAVGWSGRAGAERLRIAMVSTPFVSVPPARYGGTELVVSELVKGLVLRGHEVVLFATGDSKAPCTVRAIFDQPVWPPEPLPELAHASWAASSIRCASFDVVHAHVPSFLAFSWSLPELPVVYTLHHDRDENLSRYYASVAGRPGFVAISRRQAAIHPEIESPSVIHHGLDPDLYPFGEKGQGHLAFLGRLSEVKGPDTAIEVATELGRELRLGGAVHADDHDFFARVLEPLLARPNVRALGNLAHGPKVELLASSDALLFPVRWNEPFGLVMVEAMLCGCPVVAFPGGSVEEVVEPGVTGFVARDREEMTRLVRDEVPKLDRRRIRARAVERFSSHRMVEDYLQVYRAAISQRVGAGVCPAAEVAAP